MIESEKPRKLGRPPFPEPHKLLRCKVEVNFQADHLALLDAARNGQTRAQFIRNHVIQAILTASKV